MNLSQLIETIQTEKIKLQPLATHVLQQHDKHTQDSYGTLLAAVLQNPPQVKSGAASLFDMLLTACGMPSRQAQLFERAKNLQPTELAEIIRIISEGQLAEVFLLDCLILMRIDSEINEEDVRLLAELSELFKLEDAQLAALISVAEHILGLSTLQAFPEELNLYNVGHWHEFIYQKISKSDLMVGISGGMWFVCDELLMEEGWSISNAELLFSQIGLIETHAHNVKVDITDSKLINPRLVFSASVSIGITGSHLVGEYFIDSKLTACIFDGVTSINISQTIFETYQARSILAFDSPLKVQSCTFKNCGNLHMVGGAFAIQTRNENTFNSSKFINCTSKLGGALALKRNDSGNVTISKCIFDHCTSKPDFDLGVVILYNEHVLMWSWGCSTSDPKLENNTFLVTDTLIQERSKDSNEIKNKINKVNKVFVFNEEI